jgi:outer membrane protein OmpA-like peptidoglycan-associated protein
MPINKPVAFTMALLLTLVVFGCQYLNHEEDQITQLETKVSEMEKTIKILVDIKEVLIKERDMYKEENVVLVAENAELKGHVTSLNGIIENMKVTRAVAGDAKTVQTSRYIIPFKSGRVYNNTASKKVAAIVAEIVKANPVSRITIVGYASHDGNAGMNMKLSKNRAEGVRDKIYEAHDNGPLHITLTALGEGSDNERKVVVTVETIP